MAALIYVAFPFTIHDASFFEILSTETENIGSVMVKNEIDLRNFGKQNLIRCRKQEGYEDFSPSK